MGLFSKMKLASVIAFILCAPSLCLAAPQAVHAPAPPAAKRSSAPLPALSLKDTDGKIRTLSEFSGRPVVLCFFCGCKACQEFGKDWGQFQYSGVLAESSRDDKKNNSKNDGNKTGDHSPLTLVIYMGDADAARSYSQGVGLDLKQTILLPDETMDATQKFSALPCPRIFVLDAKGALRYTNNHPDDLPQKATAAVIIAHVVDTLRHLDPPQKKPDGKRANPAQNRKPKQSKRKIHA